MVCTHVCLDGVMNSFLSFARVLIPGRGGLQSIQRSMLNAQGSRLKAQGARGKGQGARGKVKIRVKIRTRVRVRVRANLFECCLRGH